MGAGGNGGQTRPMMNLMQQNQQMVMQQQMQQQFGQQMRQQPQQQPQRMMGKPKPLGESAIDTGPGSLDTSS